MAVKNRDQVGWIDCHLCGREATVHQCAVGRGGAARRLYYRCAHCGCIQPRSDGGQDVLRRDMRPMEAGAKGVKGAAPEPAPAAAPDDEYVPGEPPAGDAPVDGAQPKRGAWSWLLHEET